MSDYTQMNRDQFLKELRKLARDGGVEFRVDTKRGKGSHITVYFGSRRTIVPGGELKEGTLAAIRKQLGISGGQR